MKEKKVAILQSNYIPWKGYFDIINSVDEFIIYDNVQYTRRDWRNRNLIKTPSGLKWLTIPVNVKGQFEIPINEVLVSSQDWRRIHWETIKNNYGNSKFFLETQNTFLSLYNNSSVQLLSKINYEFILAINSFLDVKTKISFSTDYQIVEGKNERLISLCLQSNASIYLSGPSAKNYIDEKEFTKNGIAVEWIDYSNYKEYHQLFPPFEHGVTILDLIFNTGKNARQYLKSFNKE